MVIYSYTSLDIGPFDDGSKQKYTDRETKALDVKVLLLSTYKKAMVYLER